MKNAIVIALPPSVNAARTVARGRIVSTRSYRDWLTRAAWEISGRIQPVPADCTSGVSVSITARMTRARDIDNIAKPALDALERAGVVGNDRIIDCVFLRRLPLKSSAERAADSESEDDYRIPDKHMLIRVNPPSARPLLYRRYTAKYPEYI